MELLAPAGSKDSMKAAILGGAEAVYLGGKAFGARRLAENFTDGEIKAAVKLAHASGVRVYVTVNTLIKESEIGAVLSFLDFINSIEADAVIVQDRGLIPLIKDNFELPIHASTQMGIHSPECAIWAQKAGLSRAILAGELDLEQVERVRRSTQIGLEVFVHGALCYSVSGQCLFSSIIGGRSGNRGLCAQPCRKLYALGSDRGYLLSTADLFSVEAIPRLLDIGVDAVKIEGRMRSAVYVFLATRAYSRAIKRAARGEMPLITERERDMLAVAFCRGFTGGHLLRQEVMQRTYPESRGLLIGEAISEGGVVMLRAGVVRKGDGVTLFSGDRKVGGFVVSTIEEDRGRSLIPSPFEIKDGRYTAYKTRDRDFALIEKRIGNMELPKVSARRRRFDYRPEGRRRKRSEGEYSFYVSSLKSLEEVAGAASRVYFEMNRHWQEAKAACERSGVEFVLMMPRFSPHIPDTEEEALMVSALGQVERYCERRLYGHHSLNMFNSHTIPELYQQALSVELSRSDIETSFHASAAGWRR